VTGGSRRANLAQEVARATEALSAAEALLEAGLLADSISRAYYSAFHWLRALLVSRGVEPRSHSGALHLFDLELVRTSVFPASCNRLLGALQRARELADYDAAVAFTAEEAAPQLEDARAFAGIARGFLVGEGWIEADPS